MLRIERRNILLEFLTAVVVASTTSILGLWIFREGPRAIFKHSILLAGDGSLEGLFIRTANQRSFLSSILHPVPSAATIGWPGNLDFSGYPIGDASNMLMFRVVRRLTGVSDVGSLIHIVSIMKIVPIAIAVLLLARLLKLPRVLSAVIAIGYSVSTFNLVRSEGHIFLSFTWAIPLGIGAIYLAYLSSIPQVDGTYPHRGWRHYLALSSLLLLVAFASFYYLFFIGLLTAALVVPVILAEIVRQKSALARQGFIQVLHCVYHRISSFLYILAFLLIGLLYQLFPIVIDAQKSVALTGIADRSPIEAVVYAGTLDSFFFDSSALFLRIVKRQDLLNFLASRISWEGSQLGALSGIAAYLGIGYLIYIIVKRFFFPSSIKSTAAENFLSDARSQFVLYLLAVAFALYISSPFNFAISRVLPEIRAWGRMSVVLTLLILCLLALLISKIWEKRLIAGILTLMLLAIPMSEAYFFHRDRPPSVAISNAAQVASAERGSTLLAMKGIYAQNCPIFIVPVYPFPEFDRPDDANLDYAELDLPLQDNGYFRWSYPAIKDTTQWSAFEPLVSEQPNFARASLKYQLSYARALGACGSVIDRTLLTPNETSQLSSITTSFNACFANLPGEIFQGASRFASLSFGAQNCGPAVDPSIADFAKRNSASDFLWRIDQPYGLKYIDKWQVFAATSPIAIREIRAKTSKAKAPTYSFLFTPLTASVPLTSVKVCIRRATEPVPVCAEVLLNSKGEGALVGDLSQSTTSVSKYEFTIAPESASHIENWGLVVEV